LTACKLPTQVFHQFDNTPKGHKKLIRWIGIDIKCVIFEPTGSYHRQLEQALILAQLHAIKINSRQARYFAKACGKLTKTDKVDALILAQMGAYLPLDSRPLPNAVIQRLKELTCARRSVVKDRVALKNRLHKTQEPFLKRQYQAILKRLERQIEEIEQIIESLDPSKMKP